MDDALHIALAASAGCGRALSSFTCESCALVPAGVLHTPLHTYCAYHRPRPHVLAVSVACIRSRGLHSHTRAAPTVPHPSFRSLSLCSASQSLLPRCFWSLSNPSHGLPPLFTTALVDSVRRSHRASRCALRRRAHQDLHTNEVPSPHFLSMLWSAALRCRPRAHCCAACWCQGG